MLTSKSPCNKEVRQYVDLVKSIANKYRLAGTMNIGSDWFEELVAAGMVGMTKALNWYDPNKGAFSTILYKVARQEMLRCLGEYHNGGRQGQNYSMARSKIVRDLKAELGGVPTKEQIADGIGKYIRGTKKKYGLKDSTIDAWLLSSAVQDSFEHLASEGGEDFRMTPTSMTTTADQEEKTIDRFDVEMVVRHVAEVHAGACHANGGAWHFDAWLLVRVEGMTLAAAGREHGYTRERVRQVVKMLDETARNALVHWDKHEGL